MRVEPDMLCALRTAVEDAIVGKLSRVGCVTGGVGDGVEVARVEIEVLHVSPVWIEDAACRGEMRWKRSG